MKYLQTAGQTDRQTMDDIWSEKLTWVFSSGEVKRLTYTHFYKMEIKIMNILKENEKSCGNLGKKYTIIFF